MSGQLTEIKQAIDSFDLEKARNLLRGELQNNPSADIFYLAAQADLNESQRLHFLEKAVNLDPFHEKATLELSKRKPSSPANATHGSRESAKPITHNRHYSDLMRGSQGKRERRKLWREQAISMTASLAPTVCKRQMSLTMRQRLTLRMTCSMRTRREASWRLKAFCAGVREPPGGFLKGSKVSTPARVKPRKPKSWSSQLLGGKG